MNNVIRRQRPVTAVNASICRRDAGMGVQEYSVDGLQNSLMNESSAVNNYDMWLQPLQLCDAAIGIHRVHFDHVSGRNFRGVEPVGGQNLSNTGARAANNDWQDPSHK